MFIHNFFKFDKNKNKSELSLVVQEVLRTTNSKPLTFYDFNKQLGWSKPGLADFQKLCTCDGVNF